MSGKIYVDISAAVQRRAGLGRYAESLVRELVPLRPDLALFFHHAEPVQSPPLGLDGVDCRQVQAGFRSFVIRVLLSHLAGISMNRLVPNARLFHATEHLLPPLKGIPTVMTVHDLFFRNPLYHKWSNRFYLNLAMPMFCRKATHLIAVSEYTRQELMRVYGIPSGKISVVTEAAAPHFKPQREEAVRKVRAAYNLPERYLLFVGTIEPRKNPVRLLHAFEEVYRAGLSDGLVMVGRKGWLPEEFDRALAASPAREAVLFPGYVTDEDLPAIYAGAQVFVYPSFAEGFGLPVLEAMSCGTPVVCSSTTSLPEVAGDAAVLVDPGDQWSIAEGVLSLLGNDARSQCVREKGIKRAGVFCWNKVAVETMKIYIRMLSSVY